MSPQFLRFAVAGGLAAAVNVAARIGFSRLVAYGPAIVLAYLVGMTTAFVLTRLFVFEPSGRRKRDEYLRFGLVNLVALAQVWLVSEVLYRWAFPMVGFAWRPETVAHAIGVASPIFTSYLGHKHFSFAAQSTAGEG